MNNTNIIRHLTYGSVFCIALMGSVIFSGCDAPKPKDRIYTVTQYSVSGEILGEWKNVRIIKGQVGWCKFETLDEKIVVITGPYRWQEQ